MTRPVFIVLRSFGEKAKKSIVETSISRNLKKNSKLN